MAAHLYCARRLYIRPPASGRSHPSLLRWQHTIHDLSPIHQQWPIPKPSPASQVSDRSLSLIRHVGVESTIAEALLYPHLLVFLDSRHSTLTDAEQFYQSPTAGQSALERIPQEVLLVIKGFLTFKSRCCVALASKFLGNIVLEQTISDMKLLQVGNDGRREFLVNLPSGSPPRRNTLPQPTQKLTHVCGEYKELLRVLSRDWDTTTIRLCQSCSAWRPLIEHYWTDKVDERCFYSTRITSWAFGDGRRCPECELDCRLFHSDIDGVSEIFRG